MNRITGLVSGMDIDSMVKSMLQADRIKVDRAQQNKQSLEWKKQLYNDINKDFANFLINARKDFGLMKTTSTGTNLNLGSSGISWHKTAVSSDDSKVTASISGMNSFSGTHTIEVETLAKGVTLTSKEGVGTVLKEGTEEKEAWKAAEAFSITINDKAIAVSAGDDLSIVARKINASGAGVKASYDSTLDRFFIQTDGVGSKVKMDFSATTDTNGQTFLNGLGLGSKPVGTDPAETLHFTTGKSSFIGTSGTVHYNGIPASIDSNTFTFNGVSFTAKSENTGPVTVTVGNDVDGAVEKITKFVDEYNKMIEKAGSLIGERPNRSYAPLTEEQKEAMTEKEVELWEERAKKGLLYRDDTLNRTLSSVRTSLYENVSGASGSFKHLTEFGISTEKYSSGSIGGKLQIDETKLRAALSSDADGVLSVLFKSSENFGSTDDKNLSAADLEKKRDESGIFTRITDELVKGMKDIINRSGTGDSSDLFRNVKSNMLIDFITGTGNLSKQGSISMLDSDMMKLDSEISKLNSWLFDRENTYYARFTAMEKAMQQASAQSGWLMQQTGGY